MAYSYFNNNKNDHMIVAFIFIVIHIVLALILFLLGLIEFVTPLALTNALTESFIGLKYFKGVFPVADLVAVITFLLTFISLVYTVKLIFKIYSILPIIGRPVELTTKTSVSDDSGNYHEKETRVTSTRKNLFNSGRK